MSDADAAFARLIADSTPEVASLLRAIRDAATHEEQRRAVGEALLIWGAGGVRLLNTIPSLAEQARPNDVLLQLLRGEIVTGRADELRRRAELSRQITNQCSSGMRDVPLLLRTFAAEALLQISNRDAKLVPPKEREYALEILSDAATEAKEIGQEEFELHVRSVLALFVGSKGVDPSATRERLSLLRTASYSPQLQAHALFGELSVLLRAETTPEVLDGIAEVAATASGLVDEAGAGPALALLWGAASMLGQNERREEAERLLRTVVTKAATAPFHRALQLCAEASIELARLLIESGDTAGVIETLKLRLPDLLDVYIAAVTPSDIKDSAQQLAATGELLFESYARLADWPAAFKLLDSLKALRTRHRRALRRDQVGRELLKLERQLFVAARGATPPLENPRADMFAAKVPAEDTLRQRIQEVRRRIRVSARHGTTHSEIAGALRSNEAVLTIGVGELRTVAFLVAGSTGDDVRMHHWDLKEWPLDRWETSLEDWLISLIIGAPNGRSLDAVLREVDAAVGTQIRDLAKKWRIKRLYWVSHRDLAAVPFWALPSLRGVDIVMIESVASLADMLAETPRPLGNKALLVSNPTGDLSIAGLQAAEIRDLLARRAFETTTLQAATRTEVAGAITQANLLHFVGHGRRDAVRSENSALMLAPRHDAMWLWMGPLLNLLDGWTSEPGGARSRVIETIGRITEWQRNGRTERLVETDIETFFGSWEGTSLRFASELLTAEELAVTPGLDRCALVILMACETGPFFRVSFVDEPSGLVEALQLAGARTVIATAWPVRELTTLLFAELLYAEFRFSDGEVNVGRALRLAAGRLRRMSREAAAKKLERVAGRFKGGNAFRLQALAHRVAQGPIRPFSDPLHWGSFYVAGTPVIRRAKARSNDS